MHYILIPLCGMQAQPTDDYIGGVSLTPDCRHVVVVGGDGEVRLLEMRRAGAQLASLACGSALHCCLTDGLTAVMGSEDGQVSFMMGASCEYCCNARTQCDTSGELWGLSGALQPGERRVGLVEVTADCQDLLCAVRLGTTFPPESLGSFSFTAGRE